MSTDAPMTEPGRGGWASTAIRVAAWVAAGVAVAWRLFDLGDRSLWFDEAFSWRLIRFPWGEMLSRAAQDVHPPLYYAVLKLWTAVAGDSVVAMRAVSVGWFVVGLVGAHAIAVEATRGSKSDAPAIAVLLLAGSPALYRYSQEVRMYTEEVALAIGSTWLLLRAIRAGTWRWWAGYAVAAAALAYTHYFGLFTIAGQGAFAIGWVGLSAWRGRVAPWKVPGAAGGVGAAALATFLFLPWAPTMFRQQAQVKRDYWASEVGEKSPVDAELWRSIVLGTIVFDRAEQVGPTVGPDRIDPRVGYLVLAAVAGIVGALAIRGDRAGPCLATAIVAPAALAVAMCLVVNRTLIESRFLLPSYALLLVGTAVVIGSVRNPVLRWYLALFVFANLAWLTSSYRRSMDLPARPESRGIVETVAKSWRPGDHVVCTSSSSYFPIQYHARGKFPVHCVRHPLLGVRHYTGGPIFTDDDFEDWDDLAGLATGRVWIVGIRSDNAAMTRPRRWRKVGESTFAEAIRWRGETVVEEWEVHETEAGAIR